MADFLPSKDKKKKPSKTQQLEHRTSKVKGVNWSATKKKWLGIVYDVFAERYENGKAKALHTPFFEHEADAIAAHATLRAQVDQRYAETTAQWAAEDPLTRDLPLGPGDAAEAEVGIVYWRPNYKNHHRPHRVVRVSAGKSGFLWMRACNLCLAQADGSVREVAFCKGHMPLEYRCPHGEGGSKAVCTICNPKSKAYTTKCLRCQDSRITHKRFLSKGGNGLCASCEATLAKQASEAGTAPPPKGERWEIVCVNKLRPLVDVAYEMHDDRKHALGTLLQNSKGRKRKTRSGAGPTDECDTTTFRFPDLLYVLRCPKTARIVLVVNVEFDEQSHEDRTAECEVGRIDDLYQAVSKLAQTEGGRGAAHPDAVAPVFHVLRLNPNACDAKPLTKLDARIQLLADRINALADPATRQTIEELAANPPPPTPIVETLFYHSKDAVHLLDAYADAGERGIFQWRGNTTHGRE